ncbi:MAG: chemotaxis protein CheD [Nitrospirota bacterium]
MIDIKSDKQHFLMSGSIFVHGKPCVVTTVLGSCVSICVWDPLTKIGGMNHYMLPFWNGEGLASPKYGSIAIPKMLEKMIRLGANKKGIQAKIFGGSEVLRVTSSAMNIGERNIMLAQDMLQEEKIPVISSDVGGKTGRKIIYDTSTGNVFVKKLANQIDDIRNV